MIFQETATKSTSGGLKEATWQGLHLWAPPSPGPSSRNASAKISLLDKPLSWHRLPPKPCSSISELIVSKANALSFSCLATAAFNRLCSLRMCLTPFSNLQVRDGKRIDKCSSRGASTATMVPESRMVPGGCLAVGFCRLGPNAL